MNHLSLNPSILREYDIRGIMGETLTLDSAFHIGKAFGTFVRRKGGKSIAVGRDGRTSSPALEERLIEGLSQTGLHIFKVGEGPTPLILFSEKHLKLDASVMVTASHNPPHFNGFKMGVGDLFLYGSEIQHLGKIVASGNFETGQGTVEEISVTNAYLDYLTKDYQHFYPPGKPLKIAWDAGNGVVGPLLKPLTVHLPFEHILLNTEVDGHFPSHAPDPSQPENLEGLRDVVLKNGCDLGLAFDGDGDRLGALDEKGHMVWGDQLTAIFAQEVLESHPGSCIIGDIKTSQTTFDFIKSLGGQPLMWRTGRSHIKAKMVETQSPFGGELSGHMFFADRYFGYDDGIYAALRLLGIVSKMKEPLSFIRERLATSFTLPERCIPCKDSRKFQVVKEVSERLKKEGIPFVDIDGIRTLGKDGWWMLRASNTSENLVIRAEGTSQATLDQLQSELSAFLSRSL